MQAAHQNVYDEGDYKKTQAGRRKNNAMLVKTVLGKVRSTTYDLPPAAYVYGKRNIGDQVSAGDVLSGWNVHRPNPEDIPGSDFQRLNKKAVQAGCVTSGDVSGFRRVVDVRLQTGPLRQQKKIKGPSKDAIYGKKSGDVASMSSLITNTYQKDWIINQRKLEAAQLATGRTNVSKGNSLRHTNASRGHHKTKVIPTGQRFVMKRFQNVASRVDIPTGGRYVEFHGDETFGANEVRAQLEAEASGRFGNAVVDAAQAQLAATATETVADEQGESVAV
jgi:hypothetical protein